MNPYASSETGTGRTVDVFSPATADALELRALLAVLASRTATDIGHARVLAITPASSEDELRARRALYEEADRAATAHRLVPSLEAPFEPPLRTLASATANLAGPDVVTLGDLLRIVEDVRRRVDAADPPWPHLAARVAEVPNLGDLGAAIGRTLDPRGNVRDDASPELVRLRGRIRGVRDKLYEQLGTIADRHRDLIGEDTVPMRGGRLVLVMQSGAHGSIDGLTHGRSGSGRSVYVEPFAVVDLNNELQQSVEDEEAERRRILRALVDRLHESRGAVAEAASLVADLDALEALVRYRQTVDGRLADLAPRHELTLVSARHPLLDPSLGDWREDALGTAGHRGSVVPLDLRLDEASRLMVVTGPNAGGKTVALKTVGLLTLCHLCAMPVPVDTGTRIPFLRAVVATIGDDQDLLTDQSTFSGRLLRLQEAWTAAGEDTLVLLDELGSGTDPEEGSALSVALVEHLVASGSLGLATTHLTRVAARALELEGAGCAAMAFDRGTGAPTYRLKPGPPGGSEAIALGRRLGLPETWLARAEALLGPEHRDLRNLLAEVEQTRAELERSLKAAEAERADVQTLERRLADRERELTDEKKRVAKNTKRELERFRLEARRRFASEIERLSEKLAKQPAGKRRQSKLAAEATERMLESAPAVEEAHAPEAVPVEVGGTVRHRGLGWQGILEKRNGGKAEVRAGGKLLRCRLDDLIGVPAEATGPKRPRRTLTTPSPTESRKELMLVGERVEDALEALDRFLDQALLGGTEEVRIVHGYGSGRLRGAVREHLRRHRAVARHRPGADGEGGDGATVARLVG